MPASRTTKHHSKVHANGHYHGPIPAPPVQAEPFPVILDWLPLAAEYPGWLFLYWTNHPKSVQRALREAKGNEATARIFMQLVRRHNGWSGPEGKVYPQPDTLEFWELIPNQVLMALYERVQELAWTLPNSLKPKPTISGATSDTSPSTTETVGGSAAESPGSGLDDN